MNIAGDIPSLFIVSPYKVACLLVRSPMGMLEAWDPATSYMFDD